MVKGLVTKWVVTKLFTMVAYQMVQTILLVTGCQTSKSLLFN